MSIDFPTDGELEAYDRGFAHAKDYWGPLEQKRIIKRLEAECDCAFFEQYKIPSKCYAHELIVIIKGEN